MTHGDRSGESYITKALGLCPLATEETQEPSLCNIFPRSRQKKYTFSRIFMNFCTKCYVIRPEFRIFAA